MSDEQPRPEQPEQPPANPMVGMVATGEAEIIRNGRVIEDDKQNTSEENR